VQNNIFNISASNNFADVVAEKLLNEYRENPLELSDVLLLLPNRRSCKTMADAFVRRQGMQPTMLPQMMPLGEMEEDVVWFGIDATQAEMAMLPAMNPMERNLLFVKIIMSRPQEFGAEKISLNQAYALARDLGNLIDTVNYEELDFANLNNLVPEEYAGHWQETLRFLEIITKYWPEILIERKSVDASKRKMQLIRTQAEIWEKHKTQKRIIVAGSTATYPAMRELVKVVANLPRGEVILNCLDKNLDEESWDEVDETHPQYELKKLLEYLGVSREEVKNIAVSQREEREVLLSEMMRPASKSDKWRLLTDKSMDRQAINGLHLLDCADVREEALCIALLMREVLETPEKTAILVTPDRNLARRVAGELERWNIKIDDSAGKPLALTPWGIFMRLVFSAAQQDAGKSEILALLKHPLCCLGMVKSDVRNQTRNMEKNVWRKRVKPNDNDESILRELQEKLLPLREIIRKTDVQLKELVEEHIRTAEKIAQSDALGGAEALWRGEAGDVGAKLVAELIENSDVLGKIDSSEYLAFFEALSFEKPVRLRYGMHPRLKILGPIEARFNQADVMILGEVNEGVWPQAAPSDPWMSRPMKKDFGFPLQEKAIGILGLDLVSFMGAKDVYLTRANRVEGAPMLKSRWWMRLETVLKAWKIDVKHLVETRYSYASEKIDEPEIFEKILAPAPTPPLQVRPRELSVSGIELLMRDPYSVFAKYILKLYPLDGLKEELTPADFGDLLHSVLEEFNNKYSCVFPESGKEILLEMGRKKFSADEKLADKKAFWWPRFAKMIEHLAEIEQDYRKEIVRVINETKGFVDWDLAGGRFRVTAKADRIDVVSDGRVNIIDYKTGKARSVKEVCAGFAPQLPLEGLIVKSGGFEGVSAADVEKLMYWQLSKKQIVIEKELEKILENTEQRIKELITLFDIEETAYICHPNPKRVPEYSDYEHLARVKEWYVNEAEDD